MYDNDASDGGVSCDGCDNAANMADWDITRFEFDGGASGGGLGHLSNSLSNVAT